MTRPKSEIFLAVVCWAAVAGMAIVVAPWILFYGFGPVFTYYPVLAYGVTGILLVILAVYVMRRIRAWLHHQAEPPPGTD